MNLERIKKWLDESVPGDRIMYLQSDWAGRRPEIQKIMMKAAERGLVALTQKRLGEGRYNYYATRVTPKSGEILRPGRWT